jgi:lactoylglutathione lyase
VGTAVEELLRRHVARGTGLSHFVINVESMDASLSALAAQSIRAEAETSPDGSDDFRTAMITDPDGNRIELVQWPAGHPDGMTAADWPD